MAFQTRPCPEITVELSDGVYEVVLCIHSNNAGGRFVTVAVRLNVDRRDHLREGFENLRD